MKNQELNRLVVRNQLQNLIITSVMDSGLPLDVIAGRIGSSVETLERCFEDSKHLTINFISDVLCAVGRELEFKA